MMNKKIIVRFLAIAGILLASWMFVDAAHASAGPVCNTNESFQLTGDGILTKLTEEIQTVLDDAYEALYNAILASSFPQAAGAAMVLYVSVFGLMFALGMVPLTVAEAAKRVIKIAIVAVMIGPTGFELFTRFIYGLFREGMDYLIYVMTFVMAQAIDPGNTQYVTPSILPDPVTGVTTYPGPFEPIDEFLMKTANSSTFSIFEAALSSGPYGMFYGGAYVIGLIYLIGAIAKSLWVYVMALLGTSLLFGLAPIFICFIMFERTRHLFDGWLSALISLSLQPVMLFTFLGFFTVLMDKSMATILAAEVCYCSKGNMPGTTADMYGWCFTDTSGTPLSVMWTVDGPMCGDEPCPDMDVFPLEIVDILSFFLLAYTAFQFHSFVIQIANDISGAFINLEQGSPVSKAISTLSSKAQGFAGSLAASGDLQKAINDTIGARSNPGTNTTAHGAQQVEHGNRIQETHDAMSTPRMPGPR
ncbi:MAG: type IV secretion system protein [Alphaproteobacteria bacterium]|nr:type IV secretion system protein [Alphaproteobacteria bacterium]